VSGNSRTLTLAQDKPVPSTGMAIRNIDNSGDQQMALMRRQIDSTKKQLIAANVTLTDTEATKFWPVYEQYSAELKKITDTCGFSLSFTQGFSPSFTRPRVLLLGF